MKNLIKYILILITVYVVVTLFRLLFLSNHTFEYSIKNYSIKEILKDRSNYTHEITNNKKHYSFNIKHNYNNKYAVLKNIIEVKEGKVECIIPEYKNKKLGNISCYYNGKNVTYTYLKQKTNIKKLSNKLKKYKLKETKKDNLSKKTINYNYKIDIYNKNLFGNTLLIWNYNGIIKIDKSIILNNYLKKDSYKNISKTINDKYITLYKDKIYIYNLKNNKKKTIKNIVDMENRIEILDIDDRYIFIKNVDDRTYYYYDSKKDKISPTFKYGFNKVKEINKKYKNIEIYKRGVYYYYVKNNIFYKASIYNPKYEMILFEQPYDKYIINNYGITLIKDNNAYIYNYDTGLRLVAISDEFKYHSDNMVEVYKKS